jgi:hypothetical protein
MPPSRKAQISSEYLLLLAVILMLALVVVYLIGGLGDLGGNWSILGGDLFQTTNGNYASMYPLAISPTYQFGNFTNGSSGNYLTLEVTNEGPYQIVLTDDTFAKDTYQSNDGGLYNSGILFASTPITISSGQTVSVNLTQNTLSVTSGCPNSIQYHYDLVFSYLLNQNGRTSSQLMESSPIIGDPPGHCGACGYFIVQCSDDPPGTVLQSDLPYG